MSKYFLWTVPGESRLRTFLWALAIIAITFPVIPLVKYFGRPDLSFPSAIVAFMLAAVIKVSGKLRRQWWYWATMIPVAGVHVLFILRVPWPRWISAGILIGFGAVDFLMIYYLLCFVAKLMGKEALAREVLRTGN